jgi:putative ABC transport system ATP-binding protein
MHAPLIEAVHLCKVFSFGDVEVRALNDVSTRIERGTFVAIMGSSGSGKSTFLNILGCLDRPSSGVYRLGGVDVTTLASDEQASIRNRQVGFVFQSFNLIPRLSAVENVELPLFYSDTPMARQRRRALELLDQVGLGERADHMPNQLSGGEQQRVAIARALINEPQILLADEPTGNLDSQTTLDIMRIFTGLHQDLGITVLVVTHEPDIAACAQRVLTFRDGAITRDRRGNAAGGSGGTASPASP